MHQERAPATRSNTREAGGHCWCPFQSGRGFCADNMLSKWKHAIILIFCVLLVCGALANSQVRGSVSESVFKKVISSTGGFNEIAGRVRVTFPRGFFAKPETVSVRISNAPTTDAVQAGYALWGVGRPYFSFDVLIEASQKPHSDYELTIMLPSDYPRQIPSNLKPTAFREVLHGSQSELHYYYEEVPTELDIKHGHLRVKVPKLSFYRLEQLYDTIIVGCVPR